MYDVALIGIGSMGSAAAYYLSKQGLRILGLDQFQPPHSFGSHAGDSRVIRKAYFEHPDYVPLLAQSYKNWNELERISGLKLFHKSGLLYIGDSNDFLLNGVKNSAEKYQLDIETEDISVSPSFSNLDNKQFLLEPNAGFVLPERTIQSYIDLAVQQGADFQFGEKLTYWEKLDNGYLLVTNKHQYHTKKIVFTAGAYIKELLPDVKIPLTVTKQSMFWFEPKHARLFQKEEFPCWFISDAHWSGIFYGFPSLYNLERKAPLVKIGHHCTGVKVSEPDGEQEVSLKDQKNMKQFVDKYFKGAFRSYMQMSTCYYTMSKDEHFIVDYIKEHDQNVILATGFSGHGFKFAPMMGEVIADLVIHGKTDMPIEFLSLSRFSS